MGGLEGTEKYDDSIRTAAKTEIVVLAAITEYAYYLHGRSRDN